MSELTIICIISGILLANGIRQAIIIHGLKKKKKGPQGPVITRTGPNAENTMREPKIGDIVIATHDTLGDFEGHVMSIENYAGRGKAWTGYRVRINGSNDLIVFRLDQIKQIKG